MDSDNNKGYKSKIITFFGTKYEINHKNINILNNSCCIYIGLVIHICIKFFTNAMLFRKLLIIIGLCAMIYLIIWQNIDSIILDCIADNILCPYINMSCVDLSYNDTYKCILKTYYIDIIYYSFIYLMSLIINLFKIIILLYIFTICCELFMMFINTTINKYIPTIRNIDNII